jgi:hypothetical protein
MHRIPRRAVVRDKNKLRKYRVLTRTPHGGGVNEGGSRAGALPLLSWREICAK